MRKFLYGFKNKKTGFFAPTYLTGRYKQKTACFKTLKNAEKAFKMQNNKDNYIIEEMVEVENENQS